MQSSDYPGLYQSADRIAASAQVSFFRCLRWHLVLLLVAAVISALGFSSAELAILQATSVLGALGCSIYLFAVRPDRTWYSARAIAESIKTLAWRYLSKAEPFDRPDEEARAHFVDTLRLLVKEHPDTVRLFEAPVSSMQISNEMLEKRSLPFQRRLEAYITGRINEQHAWYASKADHNRRMAKGFFIALVVVNSLTVVAVLLRIRWPDALFWPTDVLIAGAASLLGWMQAKRFSELSSSYALTTHEIDFIRESARRVGSDSELSAFVADAEAAFSREHTQWIARKDT